VAFLKFIKRDENEIFKQQQHASYHNNASIAFPPQILTTMERKSHNSDNINSFVFVEEAHRKRIIE